MDYKKQMLPTQCTFAAPHGVPFNLTIAFFYSFRRTKTMTTSVVSLITTEFGTENKKNGKTSEWI